MLESFRHGQRDQDKDITFTLVNSHDPTHSSRYQNTYKIGISTSSFTRTRHPSRPTGICRISFKQPIPTASHASPSQDLQDYRTCRIIMNGTKDAHFDRLEPSTDRILVVVKLPLVPCQVQSTRRRTNPFLRHSKEFQLYLPNWSRHRP